MAGLLILLGTLGWWSWQLKKMKDALEGAQVDLLRLRSSLQIYKMDNGGFPTTAQGLDALLRPLTMPPAPKNWRGPYSAGILLDPWGNPFVYRSPGLRNPDGYDLSSVGPDGTPGTQDDIER